MGDTTATGTVAPLRPEGGVQTRPPRHGSLRRCLVASLALGATGLTAVAIGSLLWWRGTPAGPLGLTAAAGLVSLLAFDRLLRRWFDRPVDRLSRTLTAGEEGRYAARASLECGGELSELGRRLDRLMAHFEQRSRSLEEAAAQATQQLDTRSDELVASYQRMFALREQLARAQQTAAAGQTAANLAHQIGTPLNLISGYVQMMIEDAEAGGDRNRLDRLHSIEEQIRRVVDFVRATLDAVRRPALPHEPVFPAAVLRRLAEVARPRLTAAGIDVVLDVDDDLPWMMGDTVQLELALLNLVNNSLDAMGQGGHLRITARRAADATIIEVIDTGQGIPPEILPKIFDPWVTTKSGGRGTGLGLSITRDVVHAHGGTITVHSTPGRGTTFTVELPGQPGAPAVRED